jgi:hypothetical protein
MIMTRFCRVVLLGLSAALVQAPAAAQNAQACKTPQHRQFDFWVGTWDVSLTGQDKLVARSVVENLLAWLRTSTAAASFARTGCR